MKNCISHRVLFILHLPPPIHGAAMMGKYIHESVNLRNQFECDFINLSISTQLEEIKKFSWRKIRSFLTLQRTIAKRVKSFRPQLIYITANTCGIAFYKDFIIVQMLKMMGCKIVMHFHNKGVANNQDKWYYSYLYKKYFNKVKVILLSNHLYSDIKKFVNQGDVYYCPNGIPPSENFKKKTGNNAHTTTILFLSNLIPEKGYLDLLYACKILKDKKKEFVCHIVGGETQQCHAKDLLSLIDKYDLQKHVYYLGSKRGIEKEKAFINADLFVFPTYNDCFPLVLLEAMQHGLPCISTNEGGIPDIIDNDKTGYVIEKKDSTALAEKINVLLNNENLRAEMGRRGQEKYLKLFTLQSFEERFTAILNDCFITKTLIP